ncbi:hypothetical protein AVEN_178343-1 [Araneus ventricosus]|uniref:Uncharacterized protein n=1 Tax=Araneus ventricosus TaxID=182803 RepID=A0A4Y2BEW2_ARAVE|nr:hypothetical protein AVEN_178343-1 [Araneus ventricosus]
MWRLNEFNLSHKSHTVVRLAVHLLQQQPLVNQDGQEAQAIERASLRKTTLTSWFELTKMILQITTFLTQIFHNIMCLIRVSQIGRSDNVVDKMLLGDCQ